MVLSNLRRIIGKNGHHQGGRSGPSKHKQQTSGWDPLAERILPFANHADDGETDAPLTPLQTATNDEELTDQILTRIRRAKSFGMDPENCLRAITFQEPTSSDAILDCLRTYGLAIFPAVYEDDRLGKITAEYNDLIENGEEFARYVEAREETAAHSYAITIERKNLPKKRFPETSALFGSPTIEEITRKFFAGQAFDFNLDLFAQWTDHTDVPASGALHWDKQLTLKSWLYVTEASEEHGAMRAGAGTAAWMRYIREDAMFDGVPYKKIINQVEEKGFPVVHTGGPAGTFFLFVTDTAHGATPVAEGKRRNIIRSRSRPVRVNEWQAWAAKQ